ncbi:MAG TPA: HAD hydrolase-like protein [Clostridiales bacterium]|jgi:FMN phosphatase YigB (HAD superfamily)|nr:HAD hydrolase-like protein [Clostridiales bacterium]
MFKPKWVFFDFGGTLFDDGPFQLLSGMEALRLAAENPEVTTAEEMAKLWRGMEARYMGHLKTPEGYYVDVTLSSMLRNLFMRSGLTYTISLRECENIFDDHNSERWPTPGIQELLSALHECGIRTAVISNTTFSAEGMAIAIDKGLPDNHMEFVITSADLLFCKPGPDVFEAAAKRAGVAASECWYCGNEHVPDVEGGAGAGMLPFIIERKYEGGLTQKTWKGHTYYAVSDWAELAKAVRGL